MRKNIADAVTKIATKRSWNRGLDRVAGKGRRRLLLLLLPLSGGCCFGPEAVDRLAVAWRESREDDNSMVTIGYNAACGHLESRYPAELR